MNTQHTPTPVAKVCPLCGSANVTCQAGARWNTTTQAWVLADMLLVGVCPACNWTGSVDKLRDRQLMSHEARACNAHDELVAALRKMLETSRQIRNGQVSNAKAAAEEMASAALAKAGAL